MVTGQSSWGEITHYMARKVGCISVSGETRWLPIGLFFLVVLLECYFSFSRKCMLHCFDNGQILKRLSVEKNMTNT